MKNTIVVLIVLLLRTPVFAQNNVVYPQLDCYLQAEKNNHGLLFCINKKQVDYKHFTKLYDHLLHPGKKLTARPVTFMDGPVVVSLAPVEIGKNTITLYQQYSEGFTQPSAALQLLGIAAGITAGALSHNRYTGVYDPYFYNGNSRYLDGSPRYLDSRAAVEATYLQSTYYRHGQ